MSFKENKIYRKFIKRFLDITFALLLSPFLLLLIFILAPLIYFEDRGNIFYKAKRRGYMGEIFYMYKFRSMKTNAPDLRNEDNSTFSSVNDPRVTKIGRFIRKTSLDEFPQIINIFKGEMSWVGPRARMPKEGVTWDQLDESTRKILSVLPGITGYTAALYRNSIDREEKREQDCYYVDNISFLLDLKVIFLTFKAVISRKNVYSSYKGKN